MRNFLVKGKTYYSIRVVKALNKLNAITKTEQGKFEDTHPMADLILTKEELIEAFTKK